MPEKAGEIHAYYTEAIRVERSHAFCVSMSATNPQLDSRQRNRLRTGAAVHHITVRFLRGLLKELDKGLPGIRT